MRASAAGAGATSSIALRHRPARRNSLEAAPRTETPSIAAAAARGDALAIWLAGLPTLARLDMMTYRIVAVGLPLLTVGIITGAWWANEAWGAYWQWDPKETAALVSRGSSTPRYMHLAHA